MQTATDPQRGRIARLLSIVATITLLAAACGSNGATTDTTETTAADSAKTADTAEPTPTEVEPVPEPEPVADPLSMGGGDRVTFEVEVVVTEAPTSAFTVGEVIWAPNCYTLFADGTFYDRGFPEPASPVPGTWENGWDGTGSTYVARANAGAVLVQTGTIEADETTGVLNLTAETVVSVSGSLLVRLTSTGRQVDGCTPVAG